MYLVARMYQKLLAAAFTILARIVVGDGFVPQNSLRDLSIIL